MNAQAIFGLQFLLSLIAWSVIFQIIFIPKLRTLTRYEVLILLTLPHVFRHAGMVFLVPGVVDQPLPPAFANPAAYGDLLAGILALVAVIALKNQWKYAIAITWLFNILGTLDLANALRNPDPIPNFGAAWFIPTFLVPLLLVTHFLIFKELIVGSDARMISKNGVKNKQE